MKAKKQEVSALTPKPSAKPNKDDLEGQKNNNQKNNNNGNNDKPSLFDLGYDSLKSAVVKGLAIYGAYEIIDSLYERTVEIHNQRYEQPDQEALNSNNADPNAPSVDAAAIDAPAIDAPVGDIPDVDIPDLPALGM